MNPVEPNYYVLVAVFVVIAIGILTAAAFALGRRPRKPRELLLLAPIAVGVGLTASSLFFNHMATLMDRLAVIGSVLMVAMAELLWSKSKIGAIGAWMVGLLLLVSGVPILDTDARRQLIVLIMIINVTWILLHHYDDRRTDNRVAPKHIA